MEKHVSDIEIKQLDKTYIKAMRALQDEVMAKLENPDILRKNTYETFEVCFHKPSLVLGAFSDERLIGFGILYLAGNDRENLAYSLDNYCGSLSEYGNVKVVIVKDGYRGNGLQRLFISRFEEYARNIGIKVLLSTVSPFNIYSKNNLELSGFTVVKKLKKYGGKERYLYYKKI